jgi:splicing factor 1
MERHGLVQMATAMWPQFRPPSDYQPVANKKMRKIMIPADKYPEYNFIGLIIGPRGNTQKRMERETGAKISIRGKGSIKEGKGKRDAKSEPDANEPLHVLLTADTEAQLEKATKMITDLLVPVEEGRNEHKRQQLRELAEINGTLRDRSWMQPTSERTWEPAKVKCQICGEISHPTSDCPLKGKGFAALPTEKQESLANEFDKFMAEIGEAPAPPADAYAEFMAEIGETTKSEPKSDAPPPWAQQPQQSSYSAVPPWQQAPTPAPWETQQAPAPAPWETQQPPMYPPDATMQPWQQYPVSYWNQPPPPPEQ